MGIAVYGPPAGGAGVRVVRNDSSVPVNAGAFGTVLFAGAYSKGPVNQYVVHTGRDHYGRVRKGDLLVSDQTQLAAKHFYDKSDSKGRLVTLRLCDGTERAATLTLRDRNCDTTIRALGPDARLQGTVGVLNAASPGTWGGQALNFGGTVAFADDAISGANFETGLTGFARGELKGASLYIEGQTRVWTIVANDEPGHVGRITIRGDLSSFVHAHTPLDWWVVRASTYANGKRRELSAVIRDGRQDRDGHFGVVVAEDGSQYNNGWDDLSLDANDALAWQKVIDEALSRHNQWEVDADDSFAGDPALQYMKPANWSGIAAAITTNTVKLKVIDWLRSGTGNGYCQRSLFTLGASAIPHVLTLTFTAGTTYTVAATDLEGVEIATGLPGGTVGSAYAAPFAFLSGHKVIAGTEAFVAGDSITIVCKALPADLPLRGGWFYPYAFAATGSGSKNVSTKYRITRVTTNNDGTQTIALGLNDDVTSAVVVPGLPQAVGTTAGPYANNAVKTLIARLYVDGVLSGTEISLSTAGTGGATDTATQEAASINTALALLAETRIEAFVSTVLGVDYVGIRATAAWANHGPAASIVIDGTTGGTINTVIGFSASVDTTAYGAAPTIGRVEFDQAFSGGKDGIAGLTSDAYADAFDLETSSLLDIGQHNLGLITVRAPSTYAKEAQQAVADYCEAQGLWFDGMFADTTADESAAVKALRDDFLPTEHAGFDFPSFGYLSTNPFGGTTPYLSTLGGLIAGEEAANEVDREGYHKANAGEAYRIDSYVRRLPTDAGDSPKPVKDHLLTPAGIRPVVHQGTSIFLYGDQAPALGFAGTIWTHKAKCILHIVAECRSNLGAYVYEIPDDALYGKLTVALRNLMRPHWRKGWFKGSTFDAACKIACNAATNPPEVQSIGKVVAAMSFEIVETAKVVEIQIGTQGLAVLS